MNELFDGGVSHFDYVASNDGVGSISWKGCREKMSRLQEDNIGDSSSGYYEQNVLFTLAYSVNGSSLTKLTALLLQSRDRSCYVSRPILSPPPL